MRKVQSAPSLVGLAVAPSIRVVRPAHAKVGPGLAPERLEQPRGAVKTYALVLDLPSAATAPSGPPPSELAMAVASRGILSATECLVVDLEQAPALTDTARDVAACMASPMLPDRSNAEMITARASQMASQAETHIRLRYVDEVSNKLPTDEELAARGSPKRERLRRKRSLDDLELLELDPEIFSRAATPPQAHGPAAGAGLRGERASPSTKRLLAASFGQQLEDSRNRLVLEQAPEGAGAQHGLSLAALEEPDHDFLLCSLDLPDDSMQSVDLSSENQLSMDSDPGGALQDSRPRSNNVVPAAALLKVIRPGTQPARRA